MKKLLSFLLSVCLICALIVPAHAAGVNISISASASSVKRGDTVTFTVSVSGSEAVTHFGLALEYDTSVFEMVDGECTADAWYPDFTPSNGFAVMYKDPTVPSGTIGWFTLRAKKDATLGSSWVGGSASAKNGAATVSSSAGGATVTVVCAHSYGSWTKVDGATGYIVYRASSQDGTYKQVATTTETNVTLVKQDAGVGYWYKVVAYRTVSGKKVLSLKSVADFCAATP